MSNLVQDSASGKLQMTDATIGEIEADARRHFEKRGSADRLVYLVMGTGRAEIATSVGVVEVVGDRNMPAGQLAMFFRCECTRLFFDISTGKCQTCLLASVTSTILKEKYPVVTTCPGYNGSATFGDVRCHVGSTHHSHKCERPRGHAGVHVGRGCSWGEDAVAKPPAKPVDPLDVEYDGVKLRELLLVAGSEISDGKVIDLPAWFRVRGGFSTSQRAAISAHWSAQLRAKVAESRAHDEAKRASVVVQLEDDCDW